MPPSGGQPLSFKLLPPEVAARRTRPSTIPCSAASTATTSLTRRTLARAASPTATRVRFMPVVRLLPARVTDRIAPSRYRSRAPLFTAGCDARPRGCANVLTGPLGSLRALPTYEPVDVPPSSGHQAFPCHTILRDAAFRAQNARSFCVLICKLAMESDNAVMRLRRGASNTPRRRKPRASNNSPSWQPRLFATLTDWVPSPCP